MEDNASFAKNFDFPFPLLCDVEREIGMAYGAADSPTAGSASRISYVIDPEGKVAQAHAKVSPKSHPKEVLESL